jgi:rubrerythrin
MAKFKSIEQVLDFAIKLEQDAVDFYTQLSGRAQNSEMKEVFHEFALEEIKHKARLQKIKDEKLFVMPDEKVTDLKLGDYIEGAAPVKNMDYRDALILAMKREKSAFILYTGLSEKTDDAELKKVFQSLALEESRHKLRFEVEYDEYIMKEN